MHDIWIIGVYIYDICIYLWIYHVIQSYINAFMHSYITLHYIALHYMTLHYIYITLHCITLHYFTLHNTHTYIHTHIYSISYARVIDCYVYYIYICTKHIYVYMCINTHVYLNNHYIEAYSTKSRLQPCAGHSIHDRPSPKRQCMSIFEKIVRWFTIWLFNSLERSTHFK